MFIRGIQIMRKDLNLEYSRDIKTEINVSGDIRKSIEKFMDLIISLAYPASRRLLSIFLFMKTDIPVFSSLAKAYSGDGSSWISKKSGVNSLPLYVILPVFLSSL